MERNFLNQKELKIELLERLYDCLLDTRCVLFLNKINNNLIKQRIILKRRIDIKKKYNIKASSTANRFLNFYYRRIIRNLI